jgi:uncharacterized surface protein with fasciclin (FAS1) repeats
VVGTTSIVTLQGSSVAVALNDRGAFLNDTAQIIIVDAPATNGVIHAINAVLMPPGAAETVTMDEAEAAPEATEAP